MMHPMLTSPGDKKDLVRKDFIYEPKLDGVRVFLIKENDKIRLMSRKEKDITFRYPELLLPENIKAKHCVIDGEIIVNNENGIPDFHLLMRRDQLSNSEHIIKLSSELPAIFMAFDVLSLEGEDVSLRPLEDRKRLLNRLITDNPRIREMIYTHDGLSLWDYIMRNKLEGVVGKQRESLYLAGKRTENWLKIKNFKTQDCVIVGFTSATKALSSLGLAVYDQGRLRFVGKVGTGFSHAFLELLLPQLRALSIDKPDFSYPSKYKDLSWVEPKLVGEIQYLDFGPEGMLRSPSFMRMRYDKPVKDCIIEEPSRPARKAAKRELIQMLNDSRWT